MLHVHQVGSHGVGRRQVGGLAGKHVCAGGPRTIKGEK